MNTKDSLRKKKVIVGLTKPIPTNITVKRPTHIPKSEMDKLEKQEKAEKLSKLSRKPKVEVPPKALKVDKNPRLSSNPNHVVPNKPQAYEFDPMSRPQTTTNAGLKEARDNVKVLAEINNRFGFNEDFDKNHTRWSDFACHPQDATVMNIQKPNQYVAPRRRDETSNPNFEDNNLPNQADKIKRHLRNVSIQQKIQGRDSHVPTTTQETLRLQDVTNLVRKTKFNPQTHHTHVVSNTSNASYIQHVDSIMEEASLADNCKPKNVPKRSIFRDDTGLKSKIKADKHKDIDVMDVDRLLRLKLDNIRAAEGLKENIVQSYRYQEPRPEKRTVEVLERINEIKPVINEGKAQNTTAENGQFPPIASKNPKSNTSSSGHTPTCSSNVANQRLNTSNLSGKSTNTQASSNNRSTVNENGEKKSVGRVTATTHSGSANSQIKNNGNISRFGHNLPKYSDQKTDSTYISGGDSTSPILDCEESLSNNIANLLNAKNENLSWLDKSEFEMRTIDLFGLDNRDNFPRMTNEKSSIGRKSATIEDELANFQQDNNGCAIDSDTINYLIMREMEYAPDPHYFENKQNQVTWIMRAILLDWMMEVCMEFTLKRETFHYAVNYVDRYLSTIPNIQKWELQLVGVTAMYLASKVEEIYAPKVADFARSADNGYTCQQIVGMELKMIKILKWFLNPPSLSTWANWYMCQWDLYVENSEFANSHPLTTSCEDGLIQFKQPNEKSYARFREIMQLIDCSVLEIQTLQYKPRTLIASFMYMTLGKHFKQFTSQQIYEEFPKSSLYLIDQQYAFNDLFGDFLVYSFGFQLVDLLPSIQYASTFFKLPLNFDLPTAAKINKENVLEGHFEEFLAYQTHHPLNVDYIKRRPRSNF